MATQVICDLCGSPGMSVRIWEAGRICETRDDDESHFEPPTENLDLCGKCATDLLKDAVRMLSTANRCYLLDRIRRDIKKQRN